MKNINLFLSLVIVLVTSCSSGEKTRNVPKCYTVWNGSFYNIVNDVANTKITRKGDWQIERYKDGSVTKLKVEWLDSCRYRLTKISGNEISGKKDLKPVIVQIISVKSNSYTIEAWAEGNNVSTYKSELLKID